MRNITAVIATLFTALLLLPGAARAACNFTSGTSTSVSLNFGTVTVQRDTPVGTVLATTSVPSSSGTIRCTTTFNYLGALDIFRTPSSYGNNVYDTNIQGVGLQLTMGGYASSAFPFTKSRGAISGLIVAGTVSANLIKTSSGAVGGGNLNVGRLGTVSLDTLLTTTINLTGTNTIAPVACSVTNTTINVPMGNVQRSTFTGVGYEGNPVQFFIPLNCDAATRVNFQIDATADSSGVPGVMAINSSATGNAASGVGIRITRSGAPVAFGTVIPVGTVANAGMYNIPLIAQYYQTLPNVTAGQANGTATFTMTYN
ncbi:putative fimbrial adhesin [Pseudomonas chlororaphis subsp. aurantiaca]|uniref:fimbrial protein n=1 Tax=Pseudomonas chlororaphis TaxID=587753 RepID=UPI000864FD25|nr:fimbrial protein [Pseudomonas chlororaphis]BAV76349.1 putative fimbrial adhesin [Pseudomonas chlororaphis subsp. aurantiaca]